MTQLKLAVIGCGAAAEKVHLPVVSTFPDVKLSALVDQSESRAARLAAMFGGPRIAQDYQTILGEVDAAILAVPNHLHASISTDLLSQGVHVLVEKPMALTVGEGEAMIEAAEASRSILAVGQLRRFYPSSRFVRQLLSSEILGSLVEFDFREGYPYEWGTVTDATFRPEAGGGVLTDLGSHALDLLIFWLGDMEPDAYRDDAMGGVEADCLLEFGGRGGLRGTVELSRTRRLANRYVFRGERGTLEVAAGAGDFNPRVSLQCEDMRLSGSVETPLTSWHDVITEQFRSFLDAIQGAAPAGVSGHEGMRVVRLIEMCREIRRPWIYPWLAPPANSESVRG